MKAYICSKGIVEDYSVACANGWQFRMNAPIKGLTKSWELTYRDELMHPRPEYSYDLHIYFDTKRDALLWVNNRVIESMQ